jgi:hypothetical protein
MPQPRPTQRVSEVLEINLPNVRLCGSEADGGVQQSDKEAPHDYEHSAVGIRHQPVFRGNWRNIAISLTEQVLSANVLYHSLSELAIHNGVWGRWADRPVLVQ